MKEDTIKFALEELIKHLETSILNLETSEKEITNELKKWNSKITVNELKQTLPNILDKVQKWKFIYTTTNNILSMDLKEFDFVLKEYSYILGECALIDLLDAEVIDWQIGIIGSEIKKLLESGESLGKCESRKN